MQMQNAGLPLSSIRGSDRIESFKSNKSLRIGFQCFLIIATAIVLGVLVWQGVTAKGAPDPTQPHTSQTVAVLDIAVLVFREGLECI
ncbi:MAG TPA: hypothetical protein VK775_04725, partial [Chthoniobacterales bacterium]|nr:hypothetical protein [Chthoniobacterales bacterium]